MQHDGAMRRLSAVELAEIVGCSPQVIAGLAARHHWCAIDDGDGARYDVTPETAFVAAHGQVTPAFGVMQTR